MNARNVDTVIVILNGLNLLITIICVHILKQHLVGGNEATTAYIRTKNVKLKHVYRSTVTSSKIACCADCGSDVECLSVNYHALTRTCESSLLPHIAVSTNSDSNNDWTALSKINQNDWFLVFLGLPGNGVDVYEAWVNGTGVTTDDVNCMKFDLTSCNGQHYRNTAVDSWSSLGIKEVRYSLYKNGQQDAFVTFNGEGHTLKSWFTNGGIIASSWTDLSSRSLFNYFSIAGHAPGRRFLINFEYNGCPSDEAYTMVIAQNAFPCNFDNHKTYPQFLYANTSSTGYPDSMTDFDIADAIAIHIKT